MVWRLRFSKGILDIFFGGGGVTRSSDVVVPNVIPSTCIRFEAAMRPRFLYRDNINMFLSKLGYSELVQRLFAKMTFFLVDPLFVRGRAQMKSLQDLSKPTRLIDHEGKLLPSHISIPQPDGTKAYIVTHDVATASKVLGVHFTPAGN